MESNKFNKFHKTNSTDNKLIIDNVSSSTKSIYNENNKNLFSNGPLTEVKLQKNYSVNSFLFNERTKPKNLYNSLLTTSFDLNKDEDKNGKILTICEVKRSRNDKLDKIFSKHFVSPQNGVQALNKIIETTKYDKYDKLQDRNFKKNYNPKIINETVSSNSNTQATQNLSKDKDLRNVNLPQIGQIGNSQYNHSDNKQESLQVKLNNNNSNDFEFENLLKSTINMSNNKLNIFSKKIISNVSNFDLNGSSGSIYKKGSESVNQKKINTFNFNKIQAKSESVEKQSLITNKTKLSNPNLIRNIISLNQKAFSIDDKIKQQGMSKNCELLLKSDLTLHTKNKFRTQNVVISNNKQKLTSLKNVNEN